MSSSNLIQTNATFALDNNWGDFLFCLLLNFYQCETKSPTKNPRGQHRMEDFLGREWKRWVFLTSPHTRVMKSVCSGQILHSDGEMLQPGLIQLHQILSIPASLTVVPCLFPAPEEPLGKFKAPAPSSVHCTPLQYHLSAFMAAGAHQFSWSEIWSWSGNNCPEGVPGRKRRHKRSEEQGTNCPEMHNLCYRMSILCQTSKLQWTWNS